MGILTLSLRLLWCVVSDIANRVMQNLVTSFDDMVSALNALSDQAAARFEQQATTAASLAASMSDTITAMREAAALNEAMAERYVQQTLMLDAATGQLVDGWSCNREKYWELAFSVNRCETHAGELGVLRAEIDFAVAVKNVNALLANGRGRGGA